MNTGAGTIVGDIQPTHYLVLLALDGERLLLEMQDEDGVPIRTWVAVPEPFLKLVLR